MNGRVKRTTGPSRDSGVTTYFYYDGCNLVQEGPANLGPTTVYAHGARADEIIARSHQQGQIVFHHYDAQGNCILLSDWVTGNIIEQYDYEAFGKPYFDDASGAGTPMSPWNNRFLFTGREWSELGSREMDGQAERPSERARTSQWLSSLKIYDYRNRMYQPELGRFMQPDPKHFTAGDYNLYRYCHNDPVNKTDAFGLLPGDPYLTADEAGIQAIRDINDTSIALGLEYSGSVYRMPDGRFSYTAPIPGTSDTSPLNHALPTETAEAALYHTHGKYDAEHDYHNFIFSQDDKQHADERNIPSYLGNPRREVRKYTPDLQNPRNGKTEIIGDSDKRPDDRTEQQARTLKLLQDLKVNQPQ